MWIFVWLSYVMSDAIFVATEHIIITAGDIDGIDETVFAEGISKVSKGFFVAGGNEVEVPIGVSR